MPLALAAFRLAGRGDNPRAAGEMRKKNCSKRRQRTFMVVISKAEIQPYAVQLDDSRTAVPDKFLLDLKKIFGKIQQSKNPTGSKNNNSLSS